MNKEVRFQISKPKRTFNGQSDRSLSRTVSETHIIEKETEFDAVAPSEQMDVEGVVNYEEEKMEVNADITSKRFSPGLQHLQNRIALRPVAGVINLFTEGFSFDNQEVQYAWTTVLGEEMAFVLDYGVLTPAFNNLLKSVDPKYEEGNIVVEIRDYRSGRDTEPANYDGKPNIFRMPLYETQHTLLADLESKKLDDDYLVKLEEVILKVVKPICINPSPEVFHTKSVEHYNKSKFFTSFSNSQSAVKNRLVAKRKRIEPRVLSAPDQQRRKKPRMGVVPFLQRIGQKPGVVALLEPEFQKQQLEVVSELEKKIERGDRPVLVREKQPYEKVSRRPWSDFYHPQYQNSLPKKILRFRVNKGPDFIMFEVIPKTNGCYDGRLKVGPEHIPNGNGEFSERFSIGNFKGAQSFIKTIRDLEVQDMSSSVEQNVNYSGQGAGQSGSRASVAPAGASVPGAVSMTGVGNIGGVGTLVSPGITPGVGTGVTPGVAPGVASGVNAGVAPTVGGGVAPGATAGMPRRSTIQTHHLHQTQQHHHLSGLPTGVPQAGTALGATGHASVLPPSGVPEQEQHDIHMNRSIQQQQSIQPMASMPRLGQHPTGGGLYPQPTLLNPNVLRTPNPAQQAQLQRISLQSQPIQPQQSQQPQVSFGAQHIAQPIITPTVIPEQIQQQTQSQQAPPQQPQPSQPAKMISTRSRMQQQQQPQASVIHHSPRESVGYEEEDHTDDHDEDDEEDVNATSPTGNLEGEDGDRKSRSRSRAAARGKGTRTRRKGITTEVSPEDNVTSPGARGKGKRGRPKKSA